MKLDDFLEVSIEEIGIFERRKLTDEEKGLWRFVYIVEIWMVERGFEEKGHGNTTKMQSFNATLPLLWPVS